MKSSTRWVLGFTAAAVALPVCWFTLVAWLFASAGCPIVRPGDTGARVAAARLERAVAALPGVTESDFGLSDAMCESVLDVRVTFNQAATSEQVAAVLRRTVNGLQTPELAEFAGTATFHHDRGPDPAFEDSRYTLRSEEATQIPTESLLDDGRAWADLSERYPGSEVSAVHRWGTWEREVTVHVLDGDNAAAISDAVGVLRELSFPERDKMSWKVCTTDDPTYRTVKSCEKIEGTLPPE